MLFSALYSVKDARVKGLLKVLGLARLLWDSSPLYRVHGLAAQVQL